MNGSPRYRPEAAADVCLLLEGTFPYVRGGVSTWVRQLIEGMPHLRFSIIYLGADAGSQGEPAYALPDNVVHLECHWLLEPSVDAPVEESLSARMKAWTGRAVTKTMRHKRFADNRVLHDELQAAPVKGLDGDAASRFTPLLAGKDALTEKDLELERAAWDTIRDKYNDAPEGLDFNHFFWTVRSMHAPLFILGNIVSHSPTAAVYHSVSTGYAGFLGAMLKSATGRPFIISEHGIYTKERELDLAQVDWIPQELDPFKVGLNDNMSYLRSVWIRFFASLGRMSYGAADEVFTLYEGNRQRQLADGARDAALRIIPNGVNVERFRAVRRPEGADIPPVLALIGRVVPIKDIKTFVRAMRIIRTRMPEAQGWLYGPEEEDEAYTRECRMLVDSLGLAHVVKFKGFGKPEEIFPQTGLCVLSSVSEGQPLVVLEGFAAGIPAVTTNVGSCSELIDGNTAEDKALGSAGAVVPIADPAALAEAAIALLSDRAAWQSASQAAIKRVETYYDEVDMIARYGQVYAQQMQQRGPEADAVQRTRVA